jgi:hypothetical protein
MMKELKLYDGKRKHNDAKLIRYDGKQNMNRNNNLSMYFTLKAKRSRLS